MAACNIPERSYSATKQAISKRRGLFVFSQPLLIAYYESRDYYLKMNKIWKKAKIKAVCACWAQVTYMTNDGTCFTSRTSCQSLIKHTESARFVQQCLDGEPPDKIMVKCWFHTDESPSWHFCRGLFLLVTFSWFLIITLEVFLTCSTCLMKIKTPGQQIKTRGASGNQNINV